MGAGAMGRGIAQVAAQNGHDVTLCDLQQGALDTSKTKLAKIMARLVEKGRVTETDAEATQSRITYTVSPADLAGSDLVIEAIVERLDIKQAVFKELERVVGPNAVLATNTSSLSVASIASACEHAGRVVGIHFFNPAPLMPLVEIIPAIQTDAKVVADCRALIDSWGKVTVLAKDTPGFIVNRVARPFYGEALRLFEEGFVPQDAQGFATIDAAMKDAGFRMGPFELMDFIGNDVNYAVTESVWTAFYYDPRYKPSFTQQRLAQAGWLGRKSGKGYYDYAEGAVAPEPLVDADLRRDIQWRILVMLINEAADAVYLQVATPKDVDLAMTRGVNYPKGLLAWADEVGITEVVETLDRLHDNYREERYRCSLLLRQMAQDGTRFFD